MASHNVYFHKNGDPVDPGDLSSQFFCACRIMSPKPATAEVKNLLVLGADVNAFSPDWGWTALAMAAYNNHADIVDVLLRQGADTNAKDGDGLTPFQIAAKKGYAKTMEAFLYHGADPNMRDEKGKTPLLLVLTNSSTKEDRVAAVDLLIRHNCWVDTPDASGETALDHIGRMKGYSWGADWKAMCDNIEAMLKGAAQTQPELRRQMAGQELAAQMTGGIQQNVSMNRLRFKSPAA